jgi:predicted RND superfamily exporter protein
MVRELLDPLFRFSAERPRLALVLLAVGTAFFAVGLTRLRTDFDVEQMFPVDDPERQAYAAYREAFDRDDGIGLVAVRARDEGPLGVFTGEHLRAIDGFVRTVKGWPEVKRVRSVTNAETPRSRGDVVEVARVIEKIPADGDLEALERARRAFVDDPLFRDNIVSARGDVCVIAIELSREAAGFAGRREVLARLEPHLRALEGGGRREVIVHGMPFARARYLEVVAHDFRTLFPISLALMAVFLYASFGTLRLVAVPFVILGTSCIWVLGALGWLGLTLNFLTQLTPVVILIVGVTDLVHLILEPGPMLAALRRVGPACFMTCVTAAIGFADLFFTNVVALVQFGIACAAGMLVTFVLEAILLPIMLPNGGVRRPAEGAAEGEHGGGHGADPVAVGAEGGHGAASVGILDRFLRAAAGLVPGAAPVVIALTAVAIVVFAAFMTRLRIEARIYDYLDADHPICRAERFFEEHLGAVLPIAVTIDTGRTDGALEAEAVSATARVRTALAGVAGLRSPRALADDLGRMYTVLEGEDPPPGGLTTGQAAQCLLLYEGAREHPVHRLLDHERRRTQVTARMNDVGTTRTFATVAEIEAILERDVRPRFPSAHTTGIAYVAQRGNHALAQNLSTGFGVSFLISFVILAILFRSIPVAAIAMVPNVLPIVLVFGALGALGLPLKATMAMTCSIAFGIAIDDTIHYLARCEEAVGLGRTHLEAAREAILESGRGMVLSTVILGLGFVIFVASDFEGNRLFGSLTAGTLLIGMVAEFLVTPALVVFFKPRFRPK